MPNNIGKRVLIEHGEVGSESLTKHVLEATGRSYCTRAATRSQAFNDREVLFYQAYNGANIDLVWLPGQTDAAGPPSHRLNEADITERQGNLQEMIAGEAIGIRHVAYGRNRTWPERRVDQHPERIISVKRHAHAKHPADR